jgi:hypothetical protein
MNDVGSRSGRDEKDSPVDGYKQRGKITLWLYLPRQRLDAHKNKRMRIPPPEKNHKTPLPTQSRMRAPLNTKFFVNLFVQFTFLNRHFWL